MHRHVTYESYPDYFDTHVVTAYDGDCECHFLVRFAMYGDEDGDWLCIADRYTDACDEPDSVRDPLTGWVGEHACIIDRTPVEWDFKDMHMLIQELCDTDLYDGFCIDLYRPGEWVCDGMAMVRCEVAAA